MFLISHTYTLELEICFWSAIFTPWNLKYVFDQPYLHPGTWNMFLISHIYILELEICFWSAIFTPWNLKYVSDQPVGVEYKQASEESNVLQQLNCDVFQIMSKRHIASTRDSQNSWSPTCKTMDDKEKRCKCFSQSICFLPPPPPPDFCCDNCFISITISPLVSLPTPLPRLLSGIIAVCSFLFLLPACKKTAIYQWLCSSSSFSAPCWVVGFVLSGLGVFKNKKNLYWFLVPCENFGSPYSDKAQQLQERCYQFLSVCTVFALCV